jgi:hypothetical protein
VNSLNGKAVFQFPMSICKFPLDSQKLLLIDTFSYAKVGETTRGPWGPGARGSAGRSTNAALLQAIIPHSLLQSHSSFNRICFYSLHSWLSSKKMPFHLPTQFDDGYWTTSKWLRVACIAASSVSPIYLVTVGTSWGVFMLVVRTSSRAG